LYCRKTWVPRTRKPRPACGGMSENRRFEVPTHSVRGTRFKQSAISLFPTVRHESGSFMNSPRRARTSPAERGSMVPCFPRGPCPSQGEGGKTMKSVGFPAGFSGFFMCCNQPRQARPGERGRPSPRGPVPVDGDGKPRAYRVGRFRPGHKRHLGKRGADLPRGGTGVRPLLLGGSMNFSGRAPRPSNAGQWPEAARHPRGPSLPFRGEDARRFEAASRPTPEPGRRIAAPFFSSRPFRSRVWWAEGLHLFRTIGPQALSHDGPPIGRQPPVHGAGPRRGPFCWPRRSGWSARGNPVFEGTSFAVY